MATIEPAGIRLSIAVLAGDNGDELTATLASLREAADELLVIDGAGTPSRQIAQKAGAKVVQHTWNNDFAAARNAALAAAKGDWVLFVDAGEQLPADQIGPLRALLALDHDRQQAYLLYIQLPPSNLQAAAECVARLRLIPKLSGVQFVGRVQETPIASLAALGRSVQLCHVTLHRGMIEHDRQRRRERAIRDLRLLDAEIPEKGQQPRLLNALAECHAILENPQAARKYYSLALRHAPGNSTEMLEAYYGLLTSIDDDQHDERMQTCLDALAVFPFDAQLLCAMGSYLQTCGRLDLAARAYETAVQFGQVNPETWHLANVAEVAAICLNTLCQIQGQDDKARQMLRETLDRLPNSLRLRRSLIDLEVKYGRVLEALAQAERLPRDFSLREAYRTAIRGACQAARKNWTTALGYLESAYDSGCREPLCLRWLAATLIAEKRPADAASIAIQWQQLDPTSAEARRLLQETATTTTDGSQMRLDDAHAAASSPALIQGVRAPLSSRG